MRKHCPATCGQCKRGKNYGNAIDQSALTTLTLRAGRVSLHAIILTEHFCQYWFLH